MADRRHDLGASPHASHADADPAPEPAERGGRSPAEVLLIGTGHLANAVGRALVDGGVRLHRLDEPTDREIGDHLDDQLDRVVVISRQDHVSLRRALVVAHYRPHLATLVTIFDHHVAAELEDAAANVQVLSMADLVAPAFAGPCLDPSMLSLLRDADGTRPRGVRAIDGHPQPVEPSWAAPGQVANLWANVEAVLRPFDASARILVYGLAGFLAVLAAETLAAWWGKAVPLVDAVYLAAKVAVTVGPSPIVDEAGDWFKLFSAVAMLIALGFTAVLTAGIVNRLVDPRLTGIVGRAAAPRRGHVIIVGLGQVGERLAELLRDLHIPVIVVENDPHATNLTRAKDRRLPIVIGDGADHRTLRRLSIRRARALAAVTSDDVENIAVAVAARRLSHNLNIALRAGDGEATAETRSLFQIGVVRDVYRIAGSALAAVVLGYEVRHAFPHEGTMYLVDHAARARPLLLTDADAANYNR